MDLEGIILSEINDRESQTLYDLTYMWNLETTQQQTKLIKTDKRLVIARGGGWRLGVREVSEGGQKVQTSSYKIIKSWGCNVKHGDYS